MTLGIRHLVVIWIIVTPLMTVVPIGYMTTHPRTTFAGFPLQTLNWQRGQLTRISATAIAVNALLWTLPFAGLAVVMHIRRK